MRGAVKLKKDAFQAWLSRGSPEAVDRYRAAKSAAVAAETKTQVWEEFGETMDKDFRWASRVFWQTIQWLRKGKQGPSQVVLDLGGELLTRSEEHFEDLLNPADIDR